MAATGKTPILLYGSTTATNTPIAGNLTNSSDGCEIAINVADKNLFFKDSGGVVNTVPIRQSSTSSNGWLSSTDWNTFNGKAPAVTYTTNYIPYGQGSTTPALSANLTFNGTNLAVGGVTGQTLLTLNAASAATQLSGYASTTFIYGLGRVGNSLALDSFDYIDFYTGSSSGPRTGTAKARMFASGGVSIGNTTDPGAANLSVSGNVVIATSGKGIDFSATAGTGTSELLDDYEEGTWTPYFGCDTTNPTITYTVQSGLYRKIGKIVYIECGLVINTTSGGSGTLRVYGLPYTHSNNSTSAGLSNAFVFGFTNALNAYVINANLDSILVYRNTSTNTLANATDLVNGAYFFISGSYTV